MKTPWIDTNKTKNKSNSNYELICKHNSDQWSQQRVTSPTSKKYKKSKRKKRKYNKTTNMSHNLHINNSQNVKKPPLQSYFPWALKTKRPETTFFSPQKTP